MPLDDAALADFLDVTFDFVCTRPLSDLVDRDRVLTALDEATRPDRVAMVQGRVTAPLRTRLLSRAKASTVKLAAWIPAPAVEPIADMIGAPLPLPPKLVDELVASEEVRDEVREMLSDAISGFIKKAVGGGDKD